MGRSVLLFVVILVAVSGCLGGISPSNGGGESDPSDEVCYTDTTKGDPTPTYCRIDDKPPDLLVENRHDRAHDVTVQVVKNSSVIYSENISIAASSDHPTRHVLEDVIQSPGEYTIRGTVDSEANDEYVESLEERYVETAGEQWVVRITEDGNVVVDRIRSR
ncbi:hypothetical protein [Natronosalvus caseinilyticus]|uniref:hypothetical protein n=1 Tax=Natronosalvus caseinilyticus TaxID=2953747 RepID=UPI0028AD6630|nr:hypothetical protein [Natronosalvus caseinilyticus]